MGNCCNSCQGIVIDISMQIDLEDLAASLVHWRCGTSQRCMVVFWPLLVSSPISSSHSRKDLLGAVPGFDDLFSGDLA